MLESAPLVVPSFRRGPFSSSSSSFSSAASEAEDFATDFKKEFSVPFLVLRNFIWPVIPGGEQKSPLPEYMKVVLLDWKSEYADGVKELVAESKLHPESTIEIGKSFNMNSLFVYDGDLVRNRNSGERVVVEKKTFEGKYVMICCFQLPVFSEDEVCGHGVQGLVDLCSELYSRGDFELIVVAKMNTFTNDEEVFNHFLSGFPSSCLVVPFQESERREFICCYLGLGLDDVGMQCLLLDVNVSSSSTSSRRVLVHEFPNFVFYYGAEAFPFTKNFLESIDLEDDPLGDNSSAIELDQLLRCNLSHLLYKIDPDEKEKEKEKVSILELKGRLVGLYLCFDGTLIETLDKLHRQCTARKLEFEIVVVYLPFDEPLDPHVFQLNMDTLMHHRIPNISWWRFPFNNSVSRRLWRLVSSDPIDSLVIVGPHGQFLDIYGANIMTDYGIDAYPFTRESLFNMELKRLQALTLESLFVHGSRDYVLGRGNLRVSVADLRGRNILLYVDCLEFRHLHLYEKLLKWYPEIKAKDPGFEVVFVRRASGWNTTTTTKVEEDVDFLVSAMPWLVCPFDVDHSALVEKKLFTRTTRNLLAEFDVAGRICSLDAETLVTAHGLYAFPFADNIRQEVIDRFCNSGHEYMEQYMEHLMDEDSTDEDIMDY